MQSLKVLNYGLQFNPRLFGMKERDGHSKWSVTEMKNLLRRCAITAK